ncbi:unnamed protein product [Soboliphyme baturini]|uniref:Uncharacterized protein n=1 Tax=Soboliphyme baturini TaxID=241478 RepID=A0A183IM14_9BILA|nr:unnamed protein product [Soboliphyme baturini]
MHEEEHVLERRDHHCSTPRTILRYLRFRLQKVQLLFALNGLHLKMMNREEDDEDNEDELDSPSLTAKFLHFAVLICCHI